MNFCEASKADEFLTIRFALGHGYEGSAGVVTVGVMGMVFALVYLWRGSTNNNTLALIRKNRTPAGETVLQELKHAVAGLALRPSG